MSKMSIEDPNWIGYSFIKMTPLQSLWLQNQFFIHLWIHLQQVKVLVRIGKKKSLEPR
jgi:hypothetical protein